MVSRLEYHLRVRHSILAIIAAFGLIVVAPFASRSFAQINSGTSAASSAFGGHSVTGAVVPPTGAVHPPTGTVPSVSPLGQSRPTPGPGFSSASGSGSHQLHRNHHRDGSYGPAIVYGVPVPYAVDLGASDAQAAESDDADNDPDEQGGPTVFDRRGSGEASYIPPVESVPHPHAAVSNQTESSEADVPVTPTSLVFKDGHTLDVANYAIIGEILFDLTPGHSRKVPLADLDLDATVKRNDDRGIVFQLPPGAQAN